jgi:hypothetical protein
LKSAVRSASMLASCDDEEDDAEGLEDSRCMRAVGDLAASIGIPTERRRLYCGDSTDLSTKYQA